jgi:hypothetical protein
VAAGEEAAVCALEEVLMQHGAIAPSPSTPAKSFPESDGSMPQQQLGPRPDLLAPQRQSHAPIPPCRLLLTGPGELGHELAAGATLRLLEGWPLCTLSLPALLAAGEGDLGAGCLALGGEALRRAGPAAPTVFHLSRLETWAVERVAKVAVEADLEGENDGESGPSLSDSRHLTFGSNGFHLENSPFR